MSSRPTVGRRTMLAGSSVLLAGLAASTLSGCTSQSQEAGPLIVKNPLVRQRADPHVTRETNGHYLMTGSVPEYDKVVLRSASTLAGLATADERTLWARPSTGTMGGYIWAPEIHRIDGRWYIYFAAGDKDDPFHIRPYVLQADGDNPMSATWSVRDRIHTDFDTFSLDATTFEHRGVRYLVWAQAEPDIDTNSNLYIARMSDPSTLQGPQVRIAVPTAEWETRGFKVNEGPAVLVRNGRIFVTFSASATDARYCLGLLTAQEDADLLDASSWTKTAGPVLRSSEADGQYGPGHNCFTTVEDGGTMIDVLVYHARSYRDISGDPLFDPNRHARAQRLYWNADGTPDFRVPVADGPTNLES